MVHSGLATIHISRIQALRMLCPPLGLIDRQRHRDPRSEIKKKMCVETRAHTDPAVSGQDELQERGLLGPPSQIEIQGLFLRKPEEPATGAQAAALFPVCEAT